MNANIEIILLAGGQSSRMEGGDKTLEPVQGQPLLRHLALECLNSKAARTHVVLPMDRPNRSQAIQDLDLNIVEAKDAHLGMSASLKAGLKAASDADAVLIMLADMPEINQTHLDLIILTYQANPEASIIRAVTSVGTPGHPVLFGKVHFEALAQLDGDQGARKILKAHKPHTECVVLDGEAATTDLDTPQDWADWRRSKQ